MLAAAAVSATASLPAMMNLHRERTAQGVTVVVAPGAGPVTVEAWVGGGVGDERHSDGTAGMAHLGEHVALAMAGARRLDGWVTPDATVFRAVASMGAARAAIGRVGRAWKRIDVLVNNAGILRPAPVAKIAAADLDAMLRVNLYGALFMTQAALPALQRHPGASIVNVASLAGRRGLTPLGGYCATKFALVGLTEALRTEVDSDTLHVGVVLPGVVETPMVQGFDQGKTLPDWPAALNMPAEWVAAAIALAVRFRLREVSVPPGAALVEELGALIPGATDALIGWMSAAGRLLARVRG